MKIGEKILNWYNKNKRDLPWRETKDPYKIWVSEIIFQQTRINQGYDYYLKFIIKFSDIYCLAKADEIEVLKAWEGLGYYSRARNMHFTAKYIVENLNGKFPNSFDELLKLKGVGKYTAVAIASICYNEPVAVVDGNVVRVISRLFAINTPQNKIKNTIEFEANKMLVNSNPCDFNQGIMDLGAMICKPSNPDCISCPINSNCKALKLNQVSNFPIKAKKTEKKKRFFNYVFFVNNNNVYVKKRTQNDIWKSLYEPFLYESGKKITAKDFEKYLTDKFSTKIVLRQNMKLKHKLSHQEIYGSLFIANIFELKAIADVMECVPINEISKYPFSKLVNNYIEIEFQKLI
ncbi:MAG TPA: A/G-specific adenine glycosylase [Bacteroidales bacterium]|nr:MAG: A/G-specific adenine glycosylase [Bacteroidetes bacterium GWF2_33_38]OFY75286.1 MAG: A/G-specific adenine glycosylase [Bacteroidetes bacterium RIFOXYA12_FULL_33_9]HBF87815.1 A/G-specific adenine glycosylase [Bacteroidales bacterium]